MPANVPVDEVVQVDAILDGLDDPSSSEVYSAVEAFSDTAIASAAARRALAGGGGGGSLPDEWTVTADGNLELPEGADGSPALQILGEGYTAPEEVAGQSQIFINAPHRGWALIAVMDSEAEGEAFRAVLEFGSAQSGANSPSRLNNDGSVYLSTVLTDQPVIDLDDSMSGWDIGPYTAPIIRYGNKFQVGPTGVVTAAGYVFPTADPHVAGAWWDNAGTLTKSAG